MRTIVFIAWVAVFFVSCPASYSQATDEGQRLFEEGDRLFYTYPASEKTDREAIAKYREAIRYLNRADSSNLKVAEGYQKIGNILEMQGQYARALTEYHHALQEKSQRVSLPDTCFLTDYLYIGNAYFYLDLYDSANLFYDKAEEISRNYSYVRELESLFNSIALLHYSLGNYWKALTYFNKTLRVLDNHSVYADSKTRLIGNIAVVKAKLGRYHEAIRDYNTIVDKDFREVFHQELGKTYLEVGKYDSAMYFLKQSLRSQQLPTQLSAYNNLARTHLMTGRKDSAEYYFTRSVAINREKLPERNTHLAAAYAGLAQFHQSKSNSEQALHYYQLALINTVFDFNDTTITATPPDISKAISLLHLFEVLRDKAGAWRQYFEQDQDTTKLVYALESYQQAIRVAQHIQKTYDNDEAKLFLVNQVAPVYEEAIATAVRLHERTGAPQYVVQAFQFSEHSKASVLAESLREVKVRASVGMNDSLMQEEHRLKQQVTALRLRLVENQDSAQNKMYRHQLNDLEIALARTIKYLQKDELYYRQKYQPDTLDVSALRHTLLRSDEALLEYFVGKEQLYLFLMTSDALQVTSVDHTAELDSALQRTRRQLYTFQPGQDDDQGSLAMLYQYLIGPVAQEVGEVSKLSIIADGPLHYLPFELLSVDGRRANYLLRTHTLHYGYSAALLKQAIDERRGFPTETVLAMAPFAGQEGGITIRSQGFNQLRTSQAEVERIGGSIYTQGQATKRQFLKIAGSYNILHLATHATVDDTNPSQSFIAFYPDQRDSLTNYRLYTNELYNMRLDSVKLVVLSACETGNGQLVRGEGVMSLARAFAYAGCPNIVTTLWKADDRTSAYLTTKMHHYLREGWEKDRALRQAKLDYLDDEHIQPSQKKPYYWAHFVFIGDPDPMYENYRFWWWLGAGAALLAGALLLMKRQQRRARQAA